MAIRLLLFMVTLVSVTAFADGGSNITCKVDSAYRGLGVGSIKCTDSNGYLRYAGTICSNDFAKVNSSDGSVQGMDPAKLTSLITSGSITLYSDEGCHNPAPNHIKDPCVWTVPQAGGLFATQGKADGWAISSDCQGKVNVPGNFFCSGTVQCGSKSKSVICQASGDGTCPTADQCASPGNKNENPDKVKNESTNDGLSKGYRVPTVAKMTVGDSTASVCFSETTYNGKPGGAGCISVDGQCPSSDACLADACVNATKTPQEVAYPSTASGGGAGSGSSGIKSGGGN